MVRVMGYDLCWKEKAPKERKKPHFPLGVTRPKKNHSCHSKQKEEEVKI